LRCGLGLRFGLALRRLITLNVLVALHMCVLGLTLRGLRLALTLFSRRLRLTLGARRTPLGRSTLTRRASFVLLFNGLVGELGMVPVLILIVSLMSWLVRVDISGHGVASRELIPRQTTVMIITPLTVHGSAVCGRGFVHWCAVMGLIISALGSHCVVKILGYLKLLLCCSCTG